jgi:hypothetical protein
VLRTGKNMRGIDYVENEEEDSHEDTKAQRRKGSEYKTQGTRDKIKSFKNLYQIHGFNL